MPFPSASRMVLPGLAQVSAGAVLYAREIMRETSERRVETRRVKPGSIFGHTQLAARNTLSCCLYIKPSPPRLRTNEIRSSGVKILINSESMRRNHIKRYL